MILKLFKSIFLFLDEIEIEKNKKKLGGGTIFLKFFEIFKSFFLFLGEIEIEKK